MSFMAVSVLACQFHVEGQQIENEHQKSTLFTRQPENTTNHSTPCLIDQFNGRVALAGDGHVIRTVQLRGTLPGYIICKIITWYSLGQLRTQVTMGITVASAFKGGTGQGKRVGEREARVRSPL